MMAPALPERRSARVGRRGVFVRMRREELRQLQEIVAAASQLIGTSNRRQIASTLRAMRKWTLEEVTETHINRVMGDCGGNKTEAARVLGIARRTLIRRDKGQRA